ncbi:hypothetical protein GGR51DRAFT_342850 [Nemania sp. FL0031]|nr:hypothetical protein GGR51DRAFT_342850 [Nemania sp. FL0031]
MVTMTSLPEGWESDYDGTRWFYRYTATGMIQYHFPQPGDEFAEFLLDAGTGPFQLTPEESLANKRRSISGSDNDTKNGIRTSGSKREKKNIEAIEEEHAMSATGYFDPNSFMYSPGGYNNISPLGNDDAGQTSRITPNNNTAPGITPQAAPLSKDKPIFNTLVGRSGAVGNGELRINTLDSNAHPAAAELPEGSQQMWSPVGYVAELATQDTLKCAEELAPIELDATTTFTPPPTQKKVSQEPAELPTYRTPTEEKAPEINPTQPTQSVMQPVDAYPLVSASFAYPPLKPDLNRVNSVSSRIGSIRRKPISSAAKPVDPAQNKFQPWTPAQGAVEQQHQPQTKPYESLPQTSVLQNQDSELGNIGGKNSGNAESPMSGDIPDTLAPPTAPSKPAPVESSNPNPETSSIPTALQPVHHQTNPLVLPGNSNQQFIPGTKARHDSISSSLTGHGLSHTPSVLKPGSSHSNASLQGPEGSSKPIPHRFSVQYTQETVIAHRPSEQIAQPNHGGQPGIIRVNTLPGHLPSANPSPPKANGSPGFLLFHEIPNTDSPSNLSNHDTAHHAEEPARPTIAPHTSNSNLISPPPSADDDEPIPVVAPLNFIKRHSSKSSEVSSITSQTQDSSVHSGKPILTPSDEISEAISVINNLTPQGTPGSNSQPFRPPVQTAIGESNKPGSTPMSEAGGRPDSAISVRPQSIHAQSPSPVANTQQPSLISQVPGQASVATPNVFKPTPIGMAPVTQGAVSPSNTGTATTQSRPPNTQANHDPPPPIQGQLIQNQNALPSFPSQPGNPGQVSASPGPTRPPGHASNPSLSQMPSAVAPSPPPSQANNIAHINQIHQPSAHGNFAQYVNNTGQQPQANMSAQAVNRPPQAPVAAPTPQMFHQPYGQNGASPQLVGRPPSTFGHPQATTQSPNFQQLTTAKPPGQQPTIQSPVGHQTLGHPMGQVSPPPPSPPHQQSSPAAQPVSPMQSQVSSPAQSIASLHVSQASTPSNAFATVNPLTGPNNGSNINTNQATGVPARPPSVPNQAFSQQEGQAKPPVNSYTIPPPPPNPPAKPYPMLPGQVTPLPSQIGSTAVPPPIQQPMPNNYAKPPGSTQQVPVGQQPAQAAPGGQSQHNGMPFQTNQMPYSSQGTMAYGAVSSAQMRPPQQQTPSPHLGQNQAIGQPPWANQPQQKPTMYQPVPIAPGQPYKPQVAHPHSVTGTPIVGQQYQFAPPPVAAQGQQLVQSSGVTSPMSPNQGKPFTSAQAGAALADAGKGLKKWTKKIFQNPAIKQTAVGIGGAVMAESMGVSGAAGAHLATSLYANTNRPPLAHAQTAPPQAHGAPGTVQHQTIQMGQQLQPGRPQLVQQQNHPQGHPQPGFPQQGQFQPRPPQPGYPQAGNVQPGQYQPAQHQPGHPQVGHSQPGHPQPGQHQAGQHQPGQPQQGHPQQGHPQQGQPQAGHPQPQPGHVQPGHTQNGQPQPSHPQIGHAQPGHNQPSHPQSGQHQPGHPQGGHPQPQPIHQHSQPQPNHTQPIRPQPVQPQPVHQQFGIQTQVRPPVIQSPPPAVGVGVNFSAQGQVQVGFTPPQQYPMVQPVMVGTLPPPPPPPPVAASAEPPSSEAKVQVNIDANVVNATAAVISSAFRADHQQQQQHAQGNAQGHAQPEHTAHTEPHGAENHGYTTESHAGGAAYTDNSYATTDTTYVDNSNYSMNNTYIDNTDVVNTTVYIDNSTVVADPGYGNAGYVDATSYASTDVTTNVVVDVDVNSTVYTDGGATTFSMEETIDVTSTTDVAVTSTDYSGNGWGDIEF